jgi:hypothetical protein
MNSSCSSSEGTAAPETFIVDVQLHASVILCNFAVSWLLHYTGVHVYLCSETRLEDYLVNWVKFIQAQIDITNKRSFLLCHSVRWCHNK